MTTPFDSLMFYTKLLTGLVLLLNVLSLVCINLLVRWVRNPRRAMVTPAGTAPLTEQEMKREFRTGARFILFGLLLAVIAVNGLAVFGNYKLRAATDQVVASYIE